MNNYIISGFSVIRKGRVITDRGIIDFPDARDDGKYFKELYKGLEVDYAKFYKMDRLCKLAFLAGEHLFSGSDVLNTYQPEEVAMVFSNSGSSLDTDIKHNDSIADRQHYFPKPAVFVYTLPNIMMGELSIRHSIRGENIFFISEKFDADHLCGYIVDLLSNTPHKACIAGWVDYLEDDYNAVLFFIEKTTTIKQGEILSAENMRKKFDKFA